MSYKNNEIINRNLRKYHIPSCSTSHHPKKNAIMISAANSIKHELAKCVGAIMIHRMGDVKFTSLVKEELESLSYAIELAVGPKFNDSIDFITEACPNNQGNRRVDLINLETEDKFEFETNHDVKKADAITIYI